MKYTYKVLRDDYSIESGVIEANTELEAMSILSNKKVLSLKKLGYDYYIDAIKEKNWKVFFQDLDIFDKKLNIKEKSVFFRQLAIMLSSGSSLLPSLEIIKESAAKSNMIKLLDNMIINGESGLQFHQLIEVNNKNFNEIEIQSIRNAEKAGNLENTLFLLSKNLEKENTLREKIKSSMVYPIFSFVAIMLILLVMVLYVVPMVQDIYKAMQIELPWYTQLFITISNSILTYWYIIILFIVGFIVLVKWLKTVKKLVYYYNWLCLKIPVIKELVVKTNIIHFSRSLSSLLTSSVDYTEALESSRKTMGNVVMREEVMLITEKVMSGNLLSTAMTSAKSFPKEFTQMVKVGEISANVENLLDKISFYYEEDVNNLLDRLTKLIEPLMTVTLLVVVAGIAAIIYLPMYSVIFESNMFNV